MKERKKLKVLSVLCSLVMCLAFASSVVVSEQYEERYEHYESNLGKGVITLLVGIVIAVNILPIIFNQTTTLETDTAGDLDTNEESLIGTWNILIIVGVMLGIIAIAM